MYATALYSYCLAHALNHGYLHLHSYALACPGIHREIATYTVCYPHHISNPDSCSLTVQNASRIRTRWPPLFPRYMHGEFIQHPNVFRKSFLFRFPQLMRT